MITGNYKRATRGSGGGLPCPFLKIEKKCPDFEKKALIVSILGLNPSLGWMYFWRKVYQSALTPQNLPCPKKCLVARLNYDYKGRVWRQKARTLVFLYIRVHE